MGCGKSSSKHTLTKYNLTKNLGKDFLKKNEKLTEDYLESQKAILIYFSASWCPPCKEFTPKLASFYKEINKNGQVLEIIFAAQDHTLEDFQKYYDEMPWATLPYNEQGLKQLKAKFGVKTIPSLILLNFDGSRLVTNCRDKVAESTNSQALFEEWTKNLQKSK